LMCSFARMRLFILLVCIVSHSYSALSIIESEDFEAAVWDVPGAAFDWSPPLIPPNVSLPAVVLPTDFLDTNTSVLTPADDHLVSVDFDDSLGLIDLGFKQQMVDMKAQFDSFVDRLVGAEKNSTDWTFVAFVTLVPLRCSAVDRVAALFDKAMETTNPGAGVISVAQRLGSAPCSRDGVCPCLDSKRRKHTTRVLELRSRSRSANVVYPLKEEFPYKVEIRQDLS